MKTSTIRNQPKHAGRPPLSDCQVLIWPLSLKNHTEAGFVLGWQTVDDDNSPMDAGCLRFPLTAVVAGILPTTKDTDLDKVNDGIDKTRRAFCFCCCCSTGDLQRVSCPGCVRRHLFDSLRVLAWYNHDNASYEQPQCTSSLDTIYYHNNHRVPWINGWNHVAEQQRQILYYNDSEQICYQDGGREGAVDSVFNRDILAWLSNAPVIVSLVNKGVPPKPWELPASSVATTATPSFGPDNPVQESGLSSYSIFLQLLSRLYHQRDRSHLHALFFAMCRKRDTPCTRCGKCREEFSRAEAINQNVVYWNELLRAIVDLVAGISLIFAFQTALFGPMDMCEALRGYFQFQSKLVQVSTVELCGFKQACLLF